jgi:hypothetical protein
VPEVEDVPAIGRKLARLTAAAYFYGSENESVRFRVEPDSDVREVELKLGQLDQPTFALADDGWELVASPVWPRIDEARKPIREPRAGEMFVRRPGGKWAPLMGPLNGAGLMELSWRDPVANIQIEKHKLALVPADARIIGSMKDALSGQIHLEGLHGWTVTVRDGACVVEAANDSGPSIRFAGRPVYRLPMVLHPPTGQPFDVIVPILGRDAVIVLGDGTILTPGRQVDVGALRGAVAVAPHRSIIQLSARGSKSGGIKTIADGELPLGILRCTIDEILATMPNQDDLVELDFIGDSRPSIRISRYRRQQLARDGERVRWHRPSDLSSAAPVTRMILDPRHEHLLEQEEEGVWRLPDRCKGPCLVYLRVGVDVVSRPLPIVLPGSPCIYSGGLVSALALPDYEERQRAIDGALVRVGRCDGGADDLKWLCDAATNLNGLPASAFDALKLLPSSAEALIHLLLSARDTGERGVIWALQNELPFLWLALPLRAWRSAIESNCTALANALESALGKETAMKEVVAWQRCVCSDVIALEPALETIFVMAQRPIGPVTGTPSLRDLTNCYIRDQHQRGGDAPNDLAERLAVFGLNLPPEIQTKSHADFAGLFAPVLLAGSACGKLVLDRELALITRRTLRENPAYVSGAWRHLIKHYGSVT